MSTGTRQSSARRRGTSYVMILGLGMILTVIGAAALSVARIRSRSITQDNDWAESQTLAFAGAEHALARIAATPDWRTQFAGTTVEVPLGSGTFRWRLVDVEDGDLTDDLAEPVHVLASGAVRGAAYKLDLRCVVLGGAMQALQTCAHSSGQFEVKPNKSLTVTGAPVSTNGELKAAPGSLVRGDVEAQLLSGQGTIQGTVTVPAPPKALPDTGAFDLYRGLATPIPDSRTISRVVLGPGQNPWGTPNARGIYFLDAGSNDVILWGTRIYGTLVVRCHRLILTGNLLMQNAESRMPTLIVNGDLDMSYFSDAMGLREGLTNTNFNPPGAPYDGQTDTDQADVYPSEIRGLVHVIGNVEMRFSARLRGTMVCDGAVTCRGDNEIIYDPGLYEDPPMGYTTGDGRVVPESWTRVVD